MHKHLCTSLLSTIKTFQGVAVETLKGVMHVTCGFTDDDDNNSVFLCARSTAKRPITDTAQTNVIQRVLITTNNNNNNNNNNSNNSDNNSIQFFILTC
jgi:hypothetical protein